jgi:hypothetical protein
MISAIFILLMCAASAFALYAILVMNMKPIRYLRRSVRRWRKNLEEYSNPVLTSVPQWWTIRERAQKILYSVAYHSEKCDCFVASSGYVSTKAIDMHYKTPFRIIRELYPVAAANNCEILSAKFIHVGTKTVMESQGGCTLPHVQDYELYLYSGMTVNNAHPYVQTEDSFVECRPLTEHIYKPKQNRVYTNQTDLPLIILRVTFAHKAGPDG